MLGFSNVSGGVGAEDLAQLQATMRAIELACSYIQVYFFFASSFFIHIRMKLWFAPFLVSWLIFLCACGCIYEIVYMLSRNLFGLKLKSL